MYPTKRLDRSIRCHLACGFAGAEGTVGEKTPIFAVFWTSAFSGVANWQQSEKVESGYTTTNLPLSNDIKIVSVFQCLHGEIGRTISDV